MGYVNDAFDNDTLAKLTGHLAVGHVRYSTAGESRLANAQPIVIDSAHGQLALGHNGNLINAGEVRDALVREGAIFQTSTDSEIVVHLFARVEGRERRDGDRGCDQPGARRLFVRPDDEGPHHRRPRPARVPPARARAPGRCLGDLLGNLRDRPHRRHLRPRRRARRDGDCHRPGAAVDEAVRAGEALAVHLRARVFLAARQLRVRRERQRGAHRVRPAAGARIRRARRRRRADSRLRRVRRGGLCRAVGHSDADGPHPQPLRRAAPSSSRSSRSATSACA